MFYCDCFVCCASLVCGCRLLVVGVVARYSVLCLLLGWCRWLGVMLMWYRCFRFEMCV